CGGSLPWTPFARISRCSKTRFCPSPRIFTAQCRTSRHTEATCLALASAWTTAGGPERVYSPSSVAIKGRIEQASVIHDLRIFERFALGNFRSTAISAAGRARRNKEPKMKLISTMILAGACNAALVFTCAAQTGAATRGATGATGSAQPPAATTPSNPTGTMPGSTTSNPATPGTMAPGTLPEQQTTTPPGRTNDTATPQSTMPGTAGATPGAPSSTPPCSTPAPGSTASPGSAVPCTTSPNSGTTTPGTSGSASPTGAGASGTVPK